MRLADVTWSAMFYFCSTWLFLILVLFSTICNSQYVGTEISAGSKLFVTASCEHDKKQGNSSSKFCPGYQDAVPTPYEGKLTAKLEDLADVFCDHCSVADVACNKLFCSPDRLMVNITLTMMSTFCTELNFLFPACYSEFCPSSLSKRSSESSESNSDSASASSDSIGGSECVPTADWSVVPGMDQWCADNCDNGNDDLDCDTEFCDCGEQEDSSNNLGSDSECLAWAASLVFSSVNGMDAWCQKTCSQGGDCPQTHCRCVSAPVTSTHSPTSSVSTSPNATVSQTTNATVSQTPNSTASSSTTASKTPNSTASSFTASSPTASSSSSTTTAIPETTSSTNSTASQSPSSTVSTTSAGSTSVTTTTSPPNNFSDTESMSVVTGIVCDHAVRRDHNVLVDRYCPYRDATSRAGYNDKITSQVLTFAPKLMCSFAEISRQSNRCPNMFCGETPLSLSLVRAGLCQVCLNFSDNLGPECAQANC